MLNKQIVCFNFVSSSYAKISSVWHDLHICSNSDNEWNSSRYYVTSVDERHQSNRDTNRIILGILYYISIFAVVVDEIYSCTCWETMGFMDCKNVIFSMSVSFMGISLFFIYKNPFYSILCISLAISLIIVLVKEKMNYKNYFYKEVEKEKEESMRWTSGIMQVGGHTVKPSSSNKNRGCFHVLKGFREES